MKKRFMVIISMLIMMTFYGCGTESNLNSCNISDSFDGNISVDFDGKVYKCEFLHTSEKSNVIKILEPQSLSGLTVSWENGIYKVSWKGLSCEFNKQFLPDTSFLSDIVYVMNTIHQKDLLKRLPDSSENSVYQGSCEAGDFKVTFDKSGNLQRIDIDSKNLHVEIESKA